MYVPELVQFPVKEIAFENEWGSVPLVPIVMLPDTVIPPLVIVSERGGVVFVPSVSDLQEAALVISGTNDPV